MMFKFSVSIILCALAARGSFGLQDNDQPPMDSFRLPANTEPVFYELQFYPIFDGVNSTFTGVANITFKTSVSDNVIVLNIKDLKVNKVTALDVKTRKNQLVNRWEYKANNEQLEIYLQNNYLSGRNYLLTITYGGSIRNDLTGLYLSSYKDNGLIK